MLSCSSAAKPILVSDSSGLTLCTSALWCLRDALVGHLASTLRECCCSCPPGLFPLMFCFADLLYSANGLPKKTWFHLRKRLVSLDASLIPHGVVSFLMNTSTTWFAGHSSALVRADTLLLGLALILRCINALIRMKSVMFEAVSVSGRYVVSRISLALR